MVMKRFRIALIFAALLVLSSSSSVFAQEPGGEIPPTEIIEPVIPSPLAPAKQYKADVIFGGAGVSERFRERYAVSVTTDTRLEIFSEGGEVTAKLNLGKGLAGKNAVVCAIDEKHLFVAFGSVEGRYERLFVTDENLRGGKKIAGGNFTEFGAGTPPGKKNTYVRVLDEGGEAFYYKKDGTLLLRRLERINKDDWKLILVNGEHALPDGYVPELTTLFGYPADKRAAEPLTKMFKAAQGDGVTLTLTSAYRSVAKQRSNWDIYVGQEMSRGFSKEQAAAEVATYTAVPGYSEHHTGLAFDIVSPSHQNLTESFENTKAFAWLSENAYKFGFILRYPKGKTDITGYTYEPWHYRYVGEVYARDMYEKGVTLEEYLSE